MSEDNTQLRYVPQLNLYYDSVRNIYMTPEGTIAYPNLPPNNVHPRNDEEPLENIRFNITTTIKIIIFVVAAVLQYAMLTNKIDDNAEKLKTTNAHVEEVDKKLKELENTLHKFESQLTINSELINQIQIHMSADRKK